MRRRLGHCGGSYRSGGAGAARASRAKVSEWVAQPSGRARAQLNFVALYYVTFHRVNVAARYTKLAHASFCRFPNILPKQKGKGGSKGNSKSAGKSANTAPTSKAARGSAGKASSTSSSLPRNKMSKNRKAKAHKQGILVVLPSGCGCCVVPCIS